MVHQQVSTGGAWLQARWPSNIPNPTASHARSSWLRAVDLCPASATFTCPKGTSRDKIAQPRFCKNLAAAGGFSQGEKTPPPGPGQRPRDGFWRECFIFGEMSVDGQLLGSPGGPALGWVVWGGLGLKQKPGAESSSTPKGHLQS